MVVGQIVGVARTFHVRRQEKTRMDEIAVDVVFLVMSSVKMTIHRRRHITGLQFRRVSAAPSLVAMAGV